MPIALVRPAPVAVDPRTVKHAYISCGENLYYVIGPGPYDQLELEDCRTLKRSSETRAHVIEECQLVRGAD